MRMQLPFTKSELVLLAVILAGAIGGTGIWLFATPDNSRLPDIGPEPTLVISKDVVAGDSSREKTYATTDRTERRTAPEPAGPVNINTAGEKELTRLRGIGPVIAARIVEDREKNGLYRTVDDLQRVKGIGPATVAKIKDSAITEN